MTKLKAFIQLDFVTVKPYFTLKTMLIFAAVALFLTTGSQNTSSGIGVGMMVGTLFLGYPFALGEKCQMDALYATLSVERKTVVLGRYVFALLINVCAILFSFVLATAGLLAARAFGLGTGIGSSLESVLALSTLFVVVQAIQLPLFFKLGYTKARLLTVLPFAAMMAGYLILMTLQNVSSGLSRFMASVFDSAMGVPLIAAAVLLVIFVSYSLSLTFYEKREF